MNYISLFTGIGGFDLALQRAGMDCEAMCEIDPHAQGVLKRRFPDVPVFDDVKQIGRNTHEPKSIDLICGGFPCQDLSIAGKRKGLDGERSGLWYEFARIIDELEPRWVFIENVPGLFSSNGGKDFAIIIGGLTGVLPKVPRDGWQNAGIAWGPRYKVAWRVLDAQFTGVPQRRRRIFLVANSRNGRAAQVLFEPTGLSGNPPSRRESGQEVAYTLRADASRGGDKGDGGINRTLITMAQGQAGAEVVEDGAPSLTTNHEAPILFDGRNMSTHDQSPTLQAKDEGYSLNYTPMVFNIMPQNSGKDYTAKETEVVQALTTNGNHSGDQGGTYILDDKAHTITEGESMWQADGSDNLIAFSASDDGRDVQENVSPTLRAMGHDQSHANGGGQVTIAWQFHGQDADVRIQEDETLPTASNTWGAGGNNMPFIGVRRLMPIECERLQGFPDGWTDGQKDTHRYKQTGNAVAVPPVEWIAKRIVQYGGEQ